MSTSSSSSSDPCVDAMLNVVKATRLLYCFTQRIKTTITTIHRRFAGYKYHYTVPYPLHDKTVYPVYDKTDSVFAAVWRRTFLPDRIVKNNQLEVCPHGHDWKAASPRPDGSLPVCHALEIIVISDRGWNYTRESGPNNSPEVSLDHTPILILRIYRWLGDTSIDAWDLLKRYFDQFLFGTGLKHSADQCVDVYSEEFDLFNLQNESDIETAVQTFRNNAEDQLRIKL